MLLKGSMIYGTMINKSLSWIYNSSPYWTVCHVGRWVHLHVTKVCNSRGNIINNRHFRDWFLIHGSNWSALIKVEPEEYWSIHKIQSWNDVSVYLVRVDSDYKTHSPQSHAEVKRICNGVNKKTPSVTAVILADTTAMMLTMMLMIDLSRSPRVAHSTNMDNLKSSMDK